MAELTLTHVDVGYNGEPVLRGIDVTVHGGEIISLIGPNGAGKTTVLKSIVRQLKLIGGTILLDGTDLSSFTSMQAARRMSVVLSRQVKPELMTCREVVAAGRYPYTGMSGRLSAHDTSVVDEAVAAVHAEDFADKPFTAVSDGQRQRILIARAVCQTPDVLVLDEPCVYLDIRYKLEILALLRDLAEKGCSVILSLHEIDLAQKVADRVMCVGGNGVTVVPVDELAGTALQEETVIHSLYGVTPRSYDALLGAAELRRTEPGTVRPEVFVVSSGGSGIPVFHRLVRRHIPFAAGILYTNDIDYRYALMTAEQVVAARPFEPLDDAAVAQAQQLISCCRQVINAGVVIGSCNSRLQEVLDYAGEKLCVSR